MIVSILTGILLFLSAVAQGAEALPPSRDIAAEIDRTVHVDPSRPLEVGHLLIEDHSSAITQATWLHIKNGLDYYKKRRPAFIILELNTPGGELYAAQKIATALTHIDTQYEIPVVCFINNWAISAGALLAYSCRYIAVVKDASMGAAEPVIIGEDNQMKAASEKINSALRTDFANRASFFGRNPYIAEAMVDKDLILVLRQGKVIKLDNEQQIVIGGRVPDRVISPKGKLPTLTADEMMEFAVADVLLPPEKVGELTDAERSAGRWPASKEPLFSSPYFKKFSSATVVSYQMDWKSRFFAFLAQPMISSLLLLGVFIGFYVELSTPGFGFAGSLGIISLILIILSSYALEIAHWLEVILLLIGIAIFVADIFVLPTFGVLSFFGLACFLAGLFGLLAPGLDSIEYEVDTQTFNAAGQVVLDRLVWFAGTVIAGGMAIFLIGRYLSPSLATFSRLVLAGNEQDVAKGYIAGPDPSTMPARGKEGHVLADLHPAGKVVIEGAIWEAISNGAFIEKGKKVVVIAFEGSSVIVKAAQENSSDIL